MKPKSVRFSWKCAFEFVAVALLMVSGAQAAHQYKVLHNFHSKPARFPYSALVVDPAGNLYGVTSSGVNGSGVVFRLSQSPSGKWVYTILHVFKGPDGSDPMGRLIFDSAGNLYGTTRQGGADDVGTVFELSPAGDKWTEKVLL